MIDENLFHIAHLLGLNCEGLNCEKLNYNFSHISFTHDYEKLSMNFHIFPKLQILSPIDENLIQNFHLLVKMLTIFTCL